MPSLNAGALEACLRNKLRAEVVAGDHRVYVLRDDDGVLIARTKLSHSWRPTTTVDASMVSRISRQLQLDQPRDLVDLVSCSLSRHDYLERAKRP
jgi:hypothetical protein